MRRRPSLPRRLALAAALLAVVTATACGGLRLGPSDASGGSLVGVADLRGATYRVAGGETPELRVLCQLAIAAMQAAGARAEDQCGKIGAADVRRSPEQTEVDTGWAYVGRVDRDLDDRPDPPLPFAELARTDAERGVTWLAPSAAPDTDVVVVGPALTAQGIRTLSALAARPDVVWCATPDAATDPRRLEAVRATYGAPAPAAVRTMDGAAVLAGVATGRCGAGEAPGTSGRIPALGLDVLEDDRGAFASGPAGPGGAAPVMRTEVFDAHPQVAQVLGAVTSRLTAEALRGMNTEVDQQGRDPRDAARRWLIAQGLIARG